MNKGRTVFAQVMAYAPHHHFHGCVDRYRGNYRVRKFTCWNHYLALAFAQLTFRESLRDIEACLSAVPEKLYHMGFRAPVSRSTLADASEKRDWRIYADFAQVLIGIARPLYAEEDLGLELEQTVYALDSTTIDLCLSVFPWARLGRDRSAVKLHALLDLRGNIPANLWITRASFADVRLLDTLLPEPGAIYVFDRGYVDFSRLAALDRRKATFVIRAKKNLNFRRLYSDPVDRETGLICDQTVKLTGRDSAAAYPAKLRRVRFRDAEKEQDWVYLTNDFALPALTVTDLYRYRWQVELFFKWIKQHLRIQAFYGTSPNAVRTQLWIAISVYVLVAIIRKRLEIDRELYTLLQILSVYAFEKTPLEQVLSAPGYTPKDADIRNQLSLFNL